VSKRQSRVSSFTTSSDSRVALPDTA